MSLTINEAIARFEANAEQNERWANAGLNPEANAEYAAEHRQLAAWLRELVERRKASEIIYCKDCTRRRKNTETGEYYCRASGLRNTDYDFCSGGKRAERRTDD
jgi:hypothetical protein